MRECVSEFVNALVKIHEVPLWSAVDLADRYAVSSADWYAVVLADNHCRKNTMGVRKYYECMNYILPHSRTRVFLHSVSKVKKL